MSREPRLGKGLMNEDWAVIESMLPPGWMEQARALGAFRRARNLADPRALLQVMLLHVAEGCAWRETAVRAELAGIARISDVALLKRLKTCGPWFEWLTQQLYAPLQSMSDWPGLPQRRLCVVDGSVIKEPGLRGSHWRLHYAIHLPSLQCQAVHVSAQDCGDSLRYFSVQAGDVFIADRGYAHPPGIAHVVAQGGDVLVRLNLVTLPLFTADPQDGLQRVDILAQVRELRCGEIGHWPVCIRAGDGTLIQGRLCAVRKSASAAERSRRRSQREARRQGRAQPRSTTLEAADYVLLFTTLTALSAEQVVDSYRYRWQIELEFKRLKSLLGLGHLKQHDPQAARSWLQGKLIVACLMNRLIAHAERFSPWGYDLPAHHPHGQSLAGNRADAGRIPSSLGAATDSSLTSLG